MLSWCMKYNNTLNTTFLHGIVTSQTNQTIFVTDVTMPAPTTSVSSLTTLVSSPTTVNFLTTTVNSLTTTVNSPTTTANSPTTMVNSPTTTLETLLVTKHDQNKIKHLGFAFIYFWIKFGNKPKNDLVPNDLKILCKLPHDKLVYQNKFHNFWNYIVAYKNHGNCIY